ncbi:bifunctional 2',3'-cyclic-nucleotide 2'-phosphodiesterase/3'-nucleotidase [Bacillus sp. 7884-1]|uniref:bifunctional 2',3'-cyclic-nucleotide 2'-phosphodiesterase/3'-nucleotidase n=1 Tax=Bacillus sp. 7884-1 TaxID=2021693 RepID=UPI000BA6895A|nr:bifunctional 2',3'-cyclic-nucleotide 2'-phosphodiesterase/3'-nucleotidase [Bacillus sp. 7884-1]PAE44476.1 2',3'-cyclic-nucleotide 2'-phosphodiesterase [Bacillus sp. 7884-1]
MKKGIKKKFKGLAVSTLALGLLATPYGGVYAEGNLPTNVLADEAFVKLKIMETTDIHGTIMDHDYFADAAVKNGLVRISTLVKSEREENPNNLLVDNGDMLQGNPFTDYVAKVDRPTFVNRLAGLDRYETAVQVSKQGWDTAETVIIVRGDDFADALAAAPLAYKYNAPILLTQTDSLNEDTKKEIKRLGATKAIVVGGKSVVSNRVTNALSSKLNLWVKRISGEDRFETAVAISKELGNPTKVVLVNGFNYPDAISAASYAAQNGYPILLTRTDAVPNVTLEALKNVTDTILVGGTSVINGKVESAVKNPQRIGGENRFETSLKVATELGSVKEKVFLATGWGFADALTGSVLAAKEGAPVVLVQKDELPSDVAELVQNKYVTVLGGTSVVSEEAITGETHPIYDAMNMLDYDVSNFGNHEFNYGLDFLQSSINGADFPFVSANVYKADGDSDPSNNKNLVNPYKIIKKEVVDKNGKKHKLNVGVIGFVPPQIMQWDKQNLEGKVITEDIVASAEKWIPEMKENGADLVVVVAHSGFTTNRDDKENAILGLSEVENVDAILLGHSHLALPGDKAYNNFPGIVDNVKGTINGVPAVQAKVDGQFLGVIDLDLDLVNGKWVVKNSQSEVMATTDVAADKEMVELMKPVHDHTIDYINSSVGETTAPIHSFFSRVQDDPSVQIVSNAQKEYMERVLKGTEYEGIPVLSSAAPFKAGRNSGNDYTSIPAGEMTIKNVADLYKFPNTVSALLLNGKELKNYLEWTATNFNQINPAETKEQPLINKDFPDYNFDTIDGVTYEVDVTQPLRYDSKGTIVANPEANRIKNLMYNGQPVTDDMKFVIATNNYRASSPIINPGGAKTIYASADESRQVVMNYIINNKVINPSADQNWKLASLNANVNLTFESSPAAKDFANKTNNIKYVKTLDTGYAQYSLKNPVDVQLLGINDFHGQLDTFSTSLNAGGAEYLAAYLKQREATNPDNTLMVHVGDSVGASSPVSALLQDEPTIELLNTLGFDVGTLGNHEFDEGVAEMMRLINGGAHPKTEAKYGVFEGASFPYVSANVVNENTNEPILKPFVVKEVNGVQIGFIGVTFSDTPTIVTPSGVAGVKFLDEAQSINKYAAELKEQGVETIVVLAHNAVKSNTDGTNPTEELVDIANAVDDEVDVIYGGHNHQYANTVVDGKLLVQSYASGTAFSDVDLTIDPITKDVIARKAEIVTTYRDKIAPDAEVKAKIDAYVADVAPILNEVIGDAPAGISRTENADGESPMGNLIADSMVEQTGTEFAFMNPGGIRAEIDSGQILWKEAFTVQPFGNDLVTMTLTGAQIKTLFEQQWGSKPRILKISGLKVSYDDSKEKGSRMVSIMKTDGTDLVDTQEYTVTVNNFMADGGDELSILKEGKNRVTHVTDLDALINYIKKFGTVNPTNEGRITKVNK